MIVTADDGHRFTGMGLDITWIAANLAGPVKISFFGPAIRNSQGLGHENSMFGVIRYHTVAAE